MGAYEALAASYDRLTNDVDYGAIVAFYEEILKKEGLKPRTAVDLACGTGSVSAILAGKGLSVFGVDMSEEMLTAPSRNAQTSKTRPGLSARACKGCAFPEASTSPSAPWTAWTISQTRRTAKRPSGGSGRR